LKGPLGGYAIETFEHAVKGHVDILDTFLVVLLDARVPGLVLVFVLLSQLGQIDVFGFDLHDHRWYPRLLRGIVTLRLLSGTEDRSQDAFGADARSGANLGGVVELRRENVEFFLLFVFRVLPKFVQGFFATLIRTSLFVAYETQKLGPDLKIPYSELLASDIAVFDGCGQGLFRDHEVDLADIRAQYLFDDDF